MQTPLKTDVQAQYIAWTMRSIPSGPMKYQETQREFEYAPGPVRLPFAAALHQLCARAGLELG